MLSLASRHIALVMGFLLVAACGDSVHDYCIEVADPECPAEEAAEPLLREHLEDTTCAEFLELLSAATQDDQDRCCYDVRVTQDTTNPGCEIE